MKLTKTKFAEGLSHLLIFCYDLNEVFIYSSSNVGPQSGPAKLSEKDQQYNSRGRAAW